MISAAYVISGSSQDVPIDASRMGRWNGATP